MCVNLKKHKKQQQLVELKWKIEPSQCWVGGIGRGGLWGLSILILPPGRWLFVGCYALWLEAGGRHRQTDVHGPCFVCVCYVSDNKLKQGTDRLMYTVHGMKPVAFNQCLRVTFIRPPYDVSMEIIRPLVLSKKTFAALKRDLPDSPEQPEELKYQSFSNTVEQISTWLKNTRNHSQTLLYLHVVVTSELSCNDDVLSTHSRTWCMLKSTEIHSLDTPSSEW